MSPAAPPAAAPRAELRTHTRRHGALLGAALAALVLAGTAGCKGEGRADPATTDPAPLPSPTSTKQEIGEENFAYTWPFTVPRGTAECRDGDKAVFTVQGGTTYALNDRARQAGYPDVGPIRASGSGGGDISLGTVLSRALKLCNP
ncbi:DUF2511 domain-containing protein [Streptomyces sulphureus]|uniref:DUF2511 domain-containing protein n=1 Tax=Streptomyces sulphureus TaxID=47758 RepID=UPI00037E67A9|nr:DUF2511 domain-containing protein [Streptomyces sulphureus]